MKERKLEATCMAFLAKELRGSYLWKINDRVTAGQPDLEVNWAGFTTKIEFKVLKNSQTIHDVWEDQRQLVTAVRYEQQTGRCWVVAYQRGKTVPDATLVYRPTRLLHGLIPRATEISSDFAQAARLLWEAGAIRCSGLNHQLVAEIIRQTHRS